MQVPSRGVPIRIRQAVTGILKLMSMKLFCPRRFSCGISNANETHILGNYNNSLCLVVSYNSRNNTCCIRTDQDDQLMTVNADDVTSIRAITTNSPIPVDIDQTIDGKGIGFLIGKDFKTGEYKVKVNSHSHGYKETIICLKESQIKINTTLPYTKKPSPMTGQQTVNYSHCILSFADIHINLDYMTFQAADIQSDNGWQMMGLDGTVYLNGSENTQLRKIRDEICFNVKKYKYNFKFFTSPDASLEQKEYALKQIASALKS